MIAQTAVEFKVEGVREQLLNLEQWLARAAQQGIGEHEVERHLFREMLALGGQLLGAFLKLVGPGDLGEAVVLGEGQAVKRLPEQHERRLLTVFGEFRLLRWVYGTRPGQKIEWAPTDQRLQLPEGELSYLLQEWEPLLGTEQAFGLVRDTLETILGFRQSVDTLERGSRQMAEAAPAFRQAQGAPKTEDEGQLLGTKHRLRGAAKKRLRKLCEFLEGNLHRMRYDEYLAAGYPIATGVIEGACRHVIKDRMERAGMRWKEPGAQAMLQLRAICANGDWHAFQDARIKHEIARLYPHANALDHVPWNLNLAL